MAERGEAAHSIKLSSLITQLRTSQAGLSAEEARKRLEQYGPNELEEAKKQAGDFS